MKTTKTISMAEFKNEVRKIAIKQKRTYYTIKAEMGEFLKDGSSNGDRIEFTVYIDGYSHISGKTPRECLEKLRDRISPKKSIIEEVLV